MKNTYLTRMAAGVALFFATAASATAQIRVVATTPDLAALARDIGGNAVSVVALAKPTEDPHFVDAKPSHIVTLNRADVLIEGGAELELGWLPPLLESSRNAKIGAGAPGRVVASSGIRMLEIPTSFDRSRGDVHSLGNPHFLMDPANVKTVARNIAARFSRVDAKSASAYAANLARFNSRIDAKTAEWQRTLAPFRGSKVVTYHKDFVYFANRFGLTIVDELEPKPGIAPSPAHLARVISEMKSQNVKVVLLQPYQNRRTAETVARRTGAAVLEMPQQPGAKAGTASYFGVMDYLVNTLAGALRGGK
jgi:zinc/manganese transport system substrate-binding protein